MLDDDDMGGAGYFDDEPLDVDAQPSQDSDCVVLSVDDEERASEMPKVKPEVAKKESKTIVKGSTKSEVTK